MRRPATHRVIVPAMTLVLLSPVVLAAAPENDLGEMLTATKSRLIQTRQANLALVETEAARGSDAPSSEEFVLGVRNRPDHQRATRSAASEADVTASGGEPRSAFASLYRSEPDYSIVEWWDGASKETKTWAIVGGVVVLLLIFVL